MAHSRFALGLGRSSPSTSSRSSPYRRPIDSVRHATQCNPTMSVGCVKPLPCLLARCGRPLPRGAWKDGLVQSGCRCVPKPRPLQHIKEGGVSAWRGGNDHGWGLRARPHGAPPRMFPLSRKTRPIDWPSQSRQPLRGQCAFTLFSSSPTKHRCFWWPSEANQNLGGPPGPRRRLDGLYALVPTAPTFNAASCFGWSFRSSPILKPLPCLTHFIHISSISRPQVQAAMGGCENTNKGARKYKPAHSHVQRTRGQDMDVDAHLSRFVDWAGSTLWPLPPSRPFRKRPRCAASVFHSIVSI